MALEPQTPEVKPKAPELKAMRCERWQLRLRWRWGWVATAVAVAVAVTVAVAFAASAAVAVSVPQRRKSIPVELKNRPPRRLENQPGGGGSNMGPK